MKHKPDYLAKKRVLDLGLDKLQASRNKMLKNGDFESVRAFDHFMNESPLANEWQELFNESQRVLNQNYKRMFKLKDRITDYLSLGSCIFVTLTFNNETLQNVSEFNRRRYVFRYLKSQSDYYVANIDYGKTNGREHYHAVVVAPSLNLKEWRIHGNANVERIRINNPDKLSKYISKLTNHAIKKTVKRNVYIYSRTPLPFEYFGTKYFGDLVEFE